MTTAIILDLDRTIFDTTKFWDDVFSAVSEIYGSERGAKFKSICDEIYSANDFVIIGAACEQTETDATKIFERLPGGYLYDDAQVFIKNNQNIFILSMGDDFTQNFKMRTVGINLPAIIIRHRDKARWILRNCLRDGKYEFFGQKFDAVKFYDDRAENFIDFDNLPNAQGFLVRRGEISDTTNLPENVEIVRNFSF